MENLEIKGDIKNYSFNIVTRTNYDVRYAAPETYETYTILCGNVFNYNGEAFKDNDYITTSKFIKCQKINNEVYAHTTSGSIYKLINPSKHYTEWCTTNNKELIPPPFN